MSGGEPATPVPPQEIADTTPYAVTPAPAQSPTITTPFESLGNAGGNQGYTPIGFESINLVTGDYLSTVTDLTVGSQGMPYGLVFQRHYDSGTRFQRGSLGLGWTHNFGITALVNSDAFEGLGLNSPINGADAIAALFVAWDILDDGSSTAKSLEGIMVASLVQRWLMDQLTGNVVAVTQPGLVEHFVKLADGSYNPPLASAARLPLDNGAYTYVAKDRTALSFDTNGNLATWRNAAGATATLTYAGSPAKLVSVTNDFRRQLAFTYDSDLLTRVQDDSGRSVSYTYETGGNYYYRARHYSSVTGRFLQVDPLGYAMGANLYAYATNDPLNANDPTGLASDIPRAGNGISIALPEIPLLGGIGSVPSITGVPEGSPLFSRPPGSPAAPSPPADTQLAQLVTPPVTLFARPPVVPPIPELIKPVEPIRPPLPKFPKNPMQPPGPGYEWRGRPGTNPGSDQGNWYNPGTGESLRPDLNHPQPIGLHWDYRAPGGDWFRWYPNGDLIPKL